MSSERDELVSAAIGHLQELKRRGSRFISLEPESLAFLSGALHAPSNPDRPSAATKPSAPRTESRMSAAPSAIPVTAKPVISVGEDRTPNRELTASTMASVPAPAPATDGSNALAASDKAEAMRELRERALVCVKCSNLAAARTQVVFGVGSVEAELMFVGEAPGADEDRQGEPFVGAAGQLLTRIIQTMGLSRETVYIANILKCRPDTPGQTSGNRKPTTEEMQTCIPYLHSQIDIIRPKVLVALGGTAIEGLLGQAAGITRMRGKWQEYRGIPLMPTFHPAYLLRNMALAEKRKVWEDMLQVMEKLEMPISEKQRTFFLPKS